MIEWIGDGGRIMLPDPIDTRRVALLAAFAPLPVLGLIAIAGLTG